MRLGISKMKGKTLVIGEGGARGEPSTSIDVPDVPRHFASSKVVRTPPLDAPSKGTSSDGSPLDGPKTAIGKEGYGAENAHMAH